MTTEEFKIKNTIFDRPEYPMFISFSDGYKENVVYLDEKMRDDAFDEIIRLIEDDVKVYREGESRAIMLRNVVRLQKGARTL